MIRRFIDRFGKAAAAVVFAGVTAAYVALPDQHVDAVEGVAIATAVVRAVGVWWVPVLPGTAWLKTSVDAILALLGALAVVIVGGLDGQEVALLVLSAMGVLGVGTAPATSTIQTSVIRSASKLETSVGWGFSLPQTQRV